VICKLQARQTHVVVSVNSILLINCVENIIGENIIGENIIGENIIGENIIGENIIGENY